MALAETRPHTVDDFERYIARPENRDRALELIEGAIVEKTMPTEEHSIIVNLLLYYLTGHAMENGLGLPGPEHRFRVPGNERNTRVPDVTMILETDSPITTRGATPRVPDVIAEVMSPDDSIDDLREKATFYIRSGARLVWLVYPRQRIVEVYRPDTPTEMLTAADTLHGYDVLPGFALPVGKLFPEKRSG